LAARNQFSSDEPAPTFIRLDEPKKEEDEGETYEDYLTQKTKTFSQVMKFYDISNINSTRAKILTTFKDG
jgi:hypothetical protein